MRIHSIMWLSITCIGTLIIAGCNRDSAQEPDPGSQTESASSAAIPSVQIVTAAAIEQTIELPGATIYGYETTMLMSKVGGFVQEEIQYDIGSMVDEHETLISLYSPELDKQLDEKEALVAQARSEKAQSTARVQQAIKEVERREAGISAARATRAEKAALLDLQETKLKRVQGLVASQAVGEELLDEAKFAVQSAKASLQAADANILTAEKDRDAAAAQLETAKADLAAADHHIQVAQAAEATVRTMAGYRTITAPFAGMITKRFVDRGAFVRPATSNSGAEPLFEITRTDKLRLVAYVPNAKSATVHTGRPARFHSVGGVESIEIEAEISRIADAYDMESRNMRVEVDMTRSELPDGQLDFLDPNGRVVNLRPGMFGRLTLPGLFRVPQTAVFTSDGDTYVLVVNADDEAVHTPVVVEQHDESRNEALIRARIVSGTRIAVGDVAEIPDGSAVVVNDK